MRLYIRSRTVSYGLSRSCTGCTIPHGLSWSCTIANRFNTDMAPVSVFLKFLKIIYDFHGYTRMAECNSDKATVGSVVRTVYTDGTPYKPCVLCQTGLMLEFFTRS